jgi:nicotinamidase-related amidase
MMFERTGPSCYSCEPLAAFTAQSRGGIVMAGFAGELSCLSTLIDAFHRKQKVTYPCDASASDAFGEMPADEVHRAVSKISGVYAETCETAERIAATTPRRHGMSAGGY